MFNPHSPVYKSLLHATIYEVNLRQYTLEGTIQAFLPHLPRLRSMGVDILWLMPIHPIGLQNRKGALGSYYSSRDFNDLNPEYGTKNDLHELIHTAHELGMKVILDWVANHAGWDNVWTLDHPDYFERNADGHFKSPYDWTDVIQIDHNNEAAHDALRDAMCYWVREFDIDGFRADLAHLTPLRYWIKARQVTEAIKPNLIWLAETEEPDYYQAFDLFYSWKWMHQTEHFCKNNQEIHELTDVLSEVTHRYPAQALQIYFTSNHDENSWNGTEYEKYGRYAQALSVFSFYYPYSVPLIYSGQEIPNQQRLAFFEKSELDWNQGAGLHDWYAKMCYHRKKMSAGFNIHFMHWGHRILAFRRGEGLGEVWVILNFNHEDFNHTIHLNNGEYRDVLSEEVFVNTGTISVLLPPGAYRVLERIS